MSKPDTFRRIFFYLMGFVALSWVWTVALILAWPAEKNPTWEPGLRLLAVCANGEACSVAYGELAQASAEGRIKGLTPPEPVGEVAESDAWLRWKTETGQPWQYEVSRSSWNFETTVRYRFDGETPVLVGLRRYDMRLFLYSIPLSIFTLAGLFFRSLRHP